VKKEAIGRPGFERRILKRQVEKEVRTGKS